MHEKCSNSSIEEGGHVKENKIPKSWAQNLSRSYTDLQSEYESLKDYLQEDEDFWDDDDEAAIRLAFGSPSSLYNNDNYRAEEDPKFVLFRQLLRDWFATTGNGNRRDDAGGDESKQWPWLRQGTKQVSHDS